MSTVCRSSNVTTTASVAARCPKVKDGKRCTLDAHDKREEHLYRPDSIEPPLKKMLMILERAGSLSVGNLWQNVWTYSDARWIIWLVDNGYLTEIGGRSHEGFYGGFAWSSCAPLNTLTDKGRAFLSEHIKVEW